MISSNMLHKSSVSNVGSVALVRGSKSVIMTRVIVLCHRDDTERLYGKVTNGQD
jgi:hypothetical protein